MRECATVEEVVAWWVFTVMSALVAMLLLLLYDSWSVRRGYRGWYILAWGEGEVNLGTLAEAVVVDSVELRRFDWRDSWLYVHPTGHVGIMKFFFRP